MINIKEYNKIILVGSSGSGKSWLSKKLAELYNYPLIHLDNEYWKPDWQKTPKEEWIACQQEIMNKDKWIIDGNYNNTMEIRFLGAELVIFLDINRLVCLISAIKRHGKKRSDLPEYLNEGRIFSKEFFEFCKIIWKFPKTSRKTIMDLHNKYPDKPFLQIKSRRKMKDLLK